MKCLKIPLLIIVSSLIVACDDSTNEEANNISIESSVVDDSKTYRNLVNLYVGKTVPYSEYSEIGQPETLTGTNNSQWVAYFPKADFTIVTNKQTDIVRTIFIGKREF